MGKELIFEKGDSEVVESFMKLSQPRLIDACALVDSKIPLGIARDLVKGKKKIRPSDDGTFIYSLCVFV